MLGVIAMSMPPLNALRTFEAVARLGSFSAAADVLCVTQSAVSHQIRNVERWLGKSLFERQGNRTQLLPHGAELAHSLAISLQDIENACLRTRETSEVLVIAAIPSVAMCWLIPRLSRFRAAHPKIKIRIIYAMHGHDINFHDVQLAFVFSHGQPSIPHVQSRFFLGGQSVAVCSPTLLERFGARPVTDADIKRLGLLHDSDTSGWRNWLQDEGINDQAASVGTTFEDFNLLRAAALSGQGVALCPIAMVQPDLEAGNLIQLSNRTTTNNADYYLLAGTSEGSSVGRQVQDFCDWAMAERASSLSAAPASDASS
jgi:LysR family transcriptional regulator, glycine cleavage system transcriptional activator